MKLSEHVEHIRQLIDKAFRNRLGRMGITLNWAKNNLKETVETGEFTNLQLPAAENHIDDLKRIIDILNTFEKETGNITDAYEKLVEEFTFTLFNRIAALKVMEAHALHPEIITRQSQHGDRSFAHFLWLEQNPQGRIEENEGLVGFLEDQLTSLSEDIPLFSPSHPYHLLPTTIELNGIINAFNKVETDAQVETNIWKSDDVLGWLYESFNNYKKTAHKESGDKTEYNKVSIQSQVYTPRWVVKFLVDNSLGKLYLEMYPDSAIKEKYKIANAPKTRTREIKPLTEVRMIDLATGSGNFILYGFDMFYDLYLDQIENYGAAYDESKLPQLIISNNLYGIDLDDRAVQLAQLGLYIKAKRKKRSAKISNFNVVSSDFFLPDYKQVRHLFENGEPLSTELEKIVIDLWCDLQQAHKFGSLIRLEEKFSFSLHGLVQQFEKTQLRLFSSQSLASYEQFKENFLATLKKAVAQNAAKHGISMLNSKTSDAITFLELLTQKYDVAVANPPYTDSADFGPELKKFVESNYKQPYKFNSNLYASFIKRCCEITSTTGYIGLIHPHTFMFIKSFEDVRKYMIEHTHIDLMVDYGLDRVNLFGPGILLDATWYVLSKKKRNEDGIYFNITANQQEKHKQASLAQAYNNLINNIKNDRVYTLPQSKLKIIEGYPFIYWISDGFREKFDKVKIKNVSKSGIGLSTSDNEKYLRYWWEITQCYSFSDWKIIAKGGKFNKWYGNLWLCAQWDNGKLALKHNPNSTLRNQSYYFKKGYFFNRASTKGVSSKILPENCLIESSIVTVYAEPKDLLNLLAYSNSVLFQYIADCLNATVSFQAGDNERVPYIAPTLEVSNLIDILTNLNIDIKKENCSFSIFETNFEQSPLVVFFGTELKNRVLAYLNFENVHLTQVLLNEAIINELIFEVYELSSADREQVETKMGISIGSMPILKQAGDTFLAELRDLMPIFTDHIQNLPFVEFEEQLVREIKEGFASMYQSNNNLEEFCIRHQVNPINVWYWFKEASILPQARTAEIAMEFLADAIRSILMEDEDGIVPLVGLPEEPRLFDRLEQYCLAKGFTSAQFMQLDGLLGRPLNDYIEHYFFQDLSDHLNLFMYLPKTPFIWHLSSGIQQGFEAFIIIYKWNRDSLFKLKKYLSDRFDRLEYREIQLQGSESAQAQSEKEKIRLQKIEVDEFTGKIEELIAEGYDPKLDDGVGKNIAPLQQKGMLRCDVLNNKQLEKYLKADW